MIKTKQKCPLGVLGNDSANQVKMQEKNIPKWISHFLQEGILREWVRLGRRRGVSGVGAAGAHLGRLTSGECVLGLERRLSPMAHRVRRLHKETRLEIREELREKRRVFMSF